jgi:hypothetical protein
MICAPPISSWFLPPFVLSPVACSQSKLIWHYGSYTHLAGLLGQVISTSQGRILHRATQTKETHTDFHASCAMRTHDPSVWAGEDTVAVSSWSDPPNDKTLWWRIQGLTLISMHRFHLFIASSGPDILLSTLFSVTLNFSFFWGQQTMFLTHTERQVKL